MLYKLYSVFGHDLKVNLQHQTSVQQEQQTTNLMTVLLANPRKLVLDEWTHQFEVCRERKREIKDETDKVSIIKTFEWIVTLIWKDAIRPAEWLGRLITWWIRRQDIFVMSEQTSLMAEDTQLRVISVPTSVLTSKRALSIIPCDIGFIIVGPSNRLLLHSSEHCSILLSLFLPSTTKNVFFITFIR